MALQQQESAGVPMAMQIWKHRQHGQEVKVIWASHGQVAYTACHHCTECEGSERCDPSRDDLADFTNAYAYLRAF